MEDWMGYVCCIAGVLLGVASYFSLGIGWAMVAICLFFAGVLILRRHEADGLDVVGDAIEAGIDLMDD